VNRPPRPAPPRRLAAVLAATLLIASLLVGSVATAFGANENSGPIAAEPSASVEPVPSVEPATEPTVESTTEPTTAPEPATEPDPAPTGTVEPDGDAVIAGLVPSVQYDEAMAHANDRITFRGGGRVTIPFTPRAGDTWKIDGKAPRALPAGNATGAAITKSRGGSWAVKAPTSLAAVALPVRPAAPAPEPGPGGAIRLRQVFGFLPYWELSDSSTRLDYRVLSTIAYFSVGSDKYGNILKKNADGTPTTGWAGWGSSKLTTVINNAHASNTRVVLTVSMFAWTSSQAANQAALLSSATARQNLARQAAIAVRDRGVDGINLDFEPIASGQADNFATFVRTVRAELNKIAPGYQLTFDTTGYIGSYPLEAATAPGGADAIFIMGYDYRTASQGSVGSIAPLTGTPYDITDTVNAYAARVPASKLILGVPWYGRAWSTDSDRVRAKNISGTKYGASTTAVYTTAMDLVAEHGRRWDGVEQTPYVVYHRENCTAAYGCVNPWRQLYFDDAESLKLKYDLVNRMDLRGAGIWALGYDGPRPELYQALIDKFVTFDAIAPTVSAGATPGSFSPNGDGVDERVTFTWSVDEAVTGFARIRKGATVYKTWAIGKSGTIVWDGIDRTGTMASDGLLHFSIEVWDAARNRTLRETPFVLDRTAGHLAWSPALFYPHDADAYAPSARVSFALGRTATTTLRIYTLAGDYVKTAWADRDLGVGTWSYTWTGFDGAGHRVPRGWYRAVLTATSWIGTTTLTRVVLVDAFSVVASPASPTGGQTLTLTLRSAEPLSSAPRVTFKQAGRTAVARTATYLGGGRWRVAFSVVSGAAGAATVSITARDGAGRTNSQSLTITVR
jgi:spore germination protein YaaH